MNIDTGLAVVLLAVLVFYLRLILLQRERAKQIRRTAEANASVKKKGKRPSQAPPRYSIVSPNRRDQIIGGIGALLIIVGVLLYAKTLPVPVLQTYWWVFMAIGIVAFSWLFRL
jgi:hypothetical protein